jgi:uncharacterized protein (DUF2126 family)
VLHPTIPVHAPLTFDVIDRWKAQTVARCIYHVAPPDGRVYEKRPRSPSEAEDRRNERFQIIDPGPGPVVIPDEESNPIFPMTLDLRLPERPGGIQIESSGLKP